MVLLTIANPVADPQFVGVGVGVGIPLGRHHRGYYRPRYYPYYGGGGGGFYGGGFYGGYRYPRYGYGYGPYFWFIECQRMDICTLRNGIFNMIVNLGVI